MTPERSSTGSYSGGDPHQATVPPDDPRIAELWRHVERLEGDAASHARSRDKGTGAFTIATPAGVRRFVILRGPALAELHDFMQRFRP